MRRDTLGLLEDIREAAENIADDTARLTFKASKRDRRVRQLVERNFEIIGEAVRRLHRHHPTVAERISGYRKIAGLRNVLIHAMT